MFQSRHRREKIFGLAPSHPLDGNAKARVWAAAGAWNRANRQPGQHWGPLTKSTMLGNRTICSNSTLTRGSPFGWVLKEGFESGFPAIRCLVHDHLLNECL